jgi:hypothetical protein
MRNSGKKDEEGCITLARYGALSKVSATDKTETYCYCSASKVVELLILHSKGSPHNCSVPVSAEVKQSGHHSSM